MQYLHRIYNVNKSAFLPFRMPFLGNMTTLVHFLDFPIFNKKKGGVYIFYRNKKRFYSTYSLF